MSKNMRGFLPRKPIEISAEEVRGLVAKYDQDSRSCKVQKLGLHKVVEALSAEGATGGIIWRVLTDKSGKYKADISETPVTDHARRRCSCFRTRKDGVKR